jgi:hypothetical protein
MTTARSTVVCSPDRHAVLEHHATADTGAFGDPAPAFHERRRDDPAPVVHPRLHAEIAVPHPLFDGGVHGAFEDVERPLQVALRRADVQPVALGHVPVEAIVDQPGEDVALDRGGLVGDQEIQHVALEDVGARRDVPGVDLVGAGFSTNSVTALESASRTSP